MFTTSTVDSRENTSECQSYKTDTNVVGTALDGFNKVTAIEPWPKSKHLVAKMLVTSLRVMEPSISTRRTRICVNTFQRRCADWQSTKWKRHTCAQYYTCVSWDSTIF